MKSLVVGVVALGQWSILGLIAFTWLIFVPGLALTLLAQLAQG